MSVAPGDGAPSRTVGIVAALLLLAALGWVVSEVGRSAGFELDLGPDQPHSLEDLAAQATDVALVAPTGHRREVLGPALVYRVTTARVLASDDGPLRVGDVVEIRQTEGSYTNIAPVLQTGWSYLVYLEPWHGPGDTPTDEHHVVGGVAVWWVDGSSGRRTTPDSPLPARVAFTGDGERLAVAGG
jgi:hypothetical protein